MADNVKIQILKTMGTLMTTAFALVAGLAWNEAIKSLISDFIKAGSATTGLLIYAIVVTIIAVIVTIILGRSLAKIGIDIEEDK
ncbi:DUF5654 family protein [Methanobrevibacter sp. DSM 116169]|uniref:DUF5654 family protein n=1 Tax=Methanobrevibacter sp. DSM 116169 TaxID=3242727 RepID=UPI0038FC5E71